MLLNVGNPGGPLRDDDPRHVEALSDLLLTQRCADLRGIQYSVQKDRYDGERYVRIEAYAGDANGGCYQPLYNDLQAMDLVKTLRLDIEPQEEQWMVSIWVEDARRGLVSYDANLNRAIVKCAAKLHGSSAAEESRKETK